MFNLQRGVPTLSGSTVCIPSSRKDASLTKEIVHILTALNPETVSIFSL